MAHEIENMDGKDCMAYAGETPWHGLGKAVSNDLTPEQMLEAAGLDWSVAKVPGFATIGGEVVSLPMQPLVRSADNKIMSMVSDDWNPVQNIDAANFFNDFVKAGDMEMHTAGSLMGGEIVWFLAKIKAGFSINGGDEIESYLQFTNYHKYGFSTDVRFTPIRVVCNNTLTLSLSTTVDKFVKISHRRVLSGDQIKLALGVSAAKLQSYKEMAEFLSSKSYKDGDAMSYFRGLFPATSNAKGLENATSRNALQAFSLLETQPGAEFARGSWWQAFNAVTYMVDHQLGRSDDNRLSSAWYGHGQKLKIKALDKAMALADA